jgi:tetratricopeptide (TPR) repeat protein
MTLNARIQKCDALIRKGSLPLARELLKNLPISRIPRDARLPLAQLARRLGLLSLGLRLLFPLINRNAKQSRGQMELFAEYAVLLVQNGSVTEAMRLLQDRDLTLHPDALLAMAWCHFERWEYELALPLLRKYIPAQPKPYFNLAGRINLAEALLATKNFAEALELLSSAIIEAEKNQHIRLMANALHLRAQVYAEKKMLKKSDADLFRALSIFGDTNAPDALLIRRQWAFNRAAECGSPKSIQVFRTEALSLKAWESVRECDLQLSKTNRKILPRLYFGTPYPGYRHRLEKTYSPPVNFLWGHTESDALDLSQRTKGVTRQNLLLLDILLRDFYLPFSAGGIFSELFPVEIYDPFLSPIRVHQCLKRLRQWFLREKIPLEVVCKNRRYLLRPTAPFSVLIPLALRHESRAESPLDKLVSAFGEKLFSREEAAQILGFSKATTNRYLLNEISDARIEKIGAGKNTRYRLLVRKDSKSG